MNVGAQHVGKQAGVAGITLATGGPVARPARLDDVGMDRANRVSAIDLGALGRTAAGVRLPGGGDESTRLERGLAALLLHAAALVPWNAARDPATALGHWSLASVGLRGFGLAAQRLPLPALRRHAPTAVATIMSGLLWLHAAPR